MFCEGVFSALCFVPFFKTIAISGVQSAPPYRASCTHGLPGLGTILAADAEAHESILSPLLCVGLTVQRTKSGKPAFFYHRSVALHCLSELLLWVQWIWPLSPHSPRPIHTLHVTQIHSFVCRPRCLNALYIWRGPRC